MCCLADSEMIARRKSSYQCDWLKVLSGRWAEEARIGHDKDLLCNVPNSAFRRAGHRNWIDRDMADSSSRTFSSLHAVWNVAGHGPKRSTQYLYNPNV